MHPRQPRALIIALLSQPVVLKSTPPLLNPSPTSTSAFSPGSSPTEEQREEDVRILKMFGVPARSQKRRCIRQTYGRIFNVLSLFNQTHQSPANFLFCAGGRAKASLEDRCRRKIRMFLFSIDIKVIAIIHRGNRTGRKCTIFRVKVMLKHIRPCGCHITPNEGK